jgi:hypothetical protein
VAEGLGTARFTKALELKKRRSARCPRVVVALVQLHPPKTTAPASGQLAAHIALGITWGGLVGDRGHRKGQLRVLGSPSARHTNTKEPRTGGPPGGGRGARGPDFFVRKSRRTYLRTPKPDCRPPGPIGNVLAIFGRWEGRQNEADQPSPQVAQVEYPASS